MYAVRMVALILVVALAGCATGMQCKPEPSQSNIDRVARLGEDVGGVSEVDLIKLVNEDTVEVADLGNRCKRLFATKQDMDRLNACHDAYNAVWEKGAALTNTAADYIDTGHMDANACSNLEGLRSDLDKRIVALRLAANANTQGKTSVSVAKELVDLLSAIFDKFQTHKQDQRNKVAKIIRGHTWTAWADVKAD